jgi:hypothetical protein
MNRESFRSNSMASHQRERGSISIWVRVGRVGVRRRVRLWFRVRVGLRVRVRVG